MTVHYPLSYCGLGLASNGQTKVHTHTQVIDKGVSSRSSYSSGSFFCFIKMQTTAEKKLPEREEEAAESEETLRLAHQLQRETIQKSKRKAKEKQSSSSSSSKASKTKSNKQAATGCGLDGARGMPGTRHEA